MKIRDKADQFYDWIEFPPNKRDYILQQLLLKPILWVLGVLMFAFGGTWIFSLGGLFFITEYMADPNPSLLLTIFSWIFIVLDVIAVYVFIMGVVENADEKYKK